MKENADETKVHQVDDSFFKKLFTSQKNARDFLVTVLPEKIKEQSDLSKVRIDLTSYISNELRKGFSDIVLKARLNTKKGKKKHVDIYFILDHKTRGKREMFIQFLKYKVYQWEKDLINKRPLRVIIPVVFYHGKSKWKIPDRFADQFDVHDDINYTCWISNTCCSIRINGNSGMRNIMM